VGYVAHMGTCETRTNFWFGTRRKGVDRTQLLQDRVVSLVFLNMKMNLPAP
jgi:hypothetical protein